MENPLFDLTDRVILVTGGLGQLGRHYAAGLINAGARVVLLDLPAEEKIRLDSIHSQTDRLLYVRADVTSKESLKNALSHVENAFGPPFGLINNAAMDSPPNSPAEENGPFEHYPEASWDRVMEVNVKGVFLCCQVFGNAMACTGRGSIVNICSTYGLVSPDQRIYDYRKAGGEAPFFKPVAYSASKSALVNMTRYMATYFAPNGVRVNTLTLGGVFNNQDETFLSGYSARGCL